MEPEEEEPHHKRPHLNNHDFSMARHSASPPPDDDKPVSFGTHHCIVIGGVCLPPLILFLCKYYCLCIK